ncbi:hypothetical protein [Ponticaulis sp.]|uniref:hypothetical protein n=1 Tax=Ponticaulis sp. TaxID=2020902 RepID=UPI000B66E701|nr:hypothetical protein [Ponticaulis sp.]MAJ09568.1 hypothetical protein [Ponticaulis sp.]RPG18909.1 MAG: hypothetical protein CBC85_001340 [Hyphomonadaceae bacterium TMED125]HBJ92374.1 hypothetical protein [Hyphomonadaceae bacterium]|tara:strand:- start:34300 stop:35733 length:1434 start_codon:yes stop_codon:yes gene_type:complete
MSLLSLEPSESSLPAEDVLSLRQAVFWLIGSSEEELGKYSDYNPILRAKTVTGRRYRSAYFWLPFVEQIEERFQTKEFKINSPEEIFSRMDFRMFFQTGNGNADSLNDPAFRERWRQRIGRAVVEHWQLLKPEGELDKAKFHKFSEDYRKWSDFFQTSQSLTEKIRDAMWLLESNSEALIKPGVAKDDQMFALSFHRNALLVSSLNDGDSVRLETWKKHRDNATAHEVTEPVFLRSALIERFILQPRKEYEAWKKRIEAWTAWPLELALKFIELKGDWKQLKHECDEAERFGLKLFWVRFSTGELLSDRPIEIQDPSVLAFVDACRAGHLTCSGYFRDEAFRKIELEEWPNLYIFHDEDDDALKIRPKTKNKSAPYYSSATVNVEKLFQWAEQNPEIARVNSSPEEVFNQLFNDLFRKEQYLPINEQVQFVARKTGTSLTRAKRIRGHVFEGLPEEMKRHVSQVGRPRDARRYEITD